ncbi:hypothetical protein [Acidithrix ferrooxidans]|uniref:hypothetical protein n=1 Tax=Acidithrix ferrooxidans TaxID=1280514 RepID=UPI001269F408|nr:hypothetical protein [Acidithrix ferrooxidans]
MITIQKHGGNSFGHVPVHGPFHALVQIGDDDATTDFSRRVGTFSRLSTTNTAGVAYGSGTPVAGGSV